MLFPKQEKWQEWNIEKESHRFFVLRWHELFDSDTFDTWQVRTANICSILHELEDSAKTVLVSKPHHHNIAALLDEAQVILDHDKVLKERLPVVKSNLSELRTCYEEKIKGREIPSIERFTSIIRITLSYLSTYLEMLFDEVERIICEEDQNFKIQLHMLTMQLGIELRTQGFSVEELRRSYELLVKYPEEDFLSRFHNLRERLLKAEKEYRCVFLIRGPGSFADIKDIGFNVSEPTKTPTKAEKEFFEQDPGDGVTPLEYRVSAMDGYSASKAAYQKIEEILAYWRIYRIGKEHHVYEKALVIPEDISSYTLHVGSEKDIWLPGDSREPDKNASDLVRRLTYFDPEHMSHASAALQYFRLSLYARKQEARLINLWIALEALFQKVGEGSLIGRLSKYVSEIMALHYVQDISRAIPIDVRKVWRASETESIREALSHSSEKILHSEDFMWLMTIPAESKLWESFAGLFSDNTLMIFRLWKLREGLFKSPFDMYKRIEQHEKNVKWQIMRIYRLRNKIAHRGTAPNDIAQLIGHLQSYFITTFHDIVHTSRKRDLVGLEDILESRSRDYAYLKERLKSNGNSVKSLSVHFVSSGFAELDSVNGPFLWENNNL